MPADISINTVLEACTRYLDVIGLVHSDQDERLKSLAQSLDGLVTAYNHCDDVEPDTVGVDSPRANYQEFSAQVSKSFPELGFYPTVDQLEGFDQEVGQGWGVDDLSDIAIDLTEVLWLAGQGRVNDAIWEFRFGYQNHWGSHLHSLRPYLHKLIYYG